jgi:hypothetical protein
LDLHPQFICVVWKQPRLCFLYLVDLWFDGFICGLISGYLGYLLISRCNSRSPGFLKWLWINTNKNMFFAAQI